MTPAVKRVLVLITGWASILLGIVGLFLPILQGVLFIVIGLIILSSEYVWAHRLLQKLKARFPKIAHASEEATHKVEHWFHRVTHKEEHVRTEEHNSNATKSDN